MDIKYIKVGKWYNVPFKVVEIKSGDIHMENGGIKAVCQPSELSEITARQDVRPEHSTVGTLSPAERWDKLWNGMHDVLFEDGIKNNETAPKYVPNRKFRKGDKVRVVEWNGRCPQCEGLLGKITTVLRDENYFGVRIQIGDSGESYCTPEPCFLELVNPVEELEISRVFDDKKMGAWIVTKDNFTHACFPYRCEVNDNIANSKEEAKSAAEAERDRLNAEHRKEQE